MVIIHRGEKVSFSLYNALALGVLRSLRGQYTSSYVLNSRRSVAPFPVTTLPAFVVTNVVPPNSHYVGMPSDGVEIQRYIASSHSRLQWVDDSVVALACRLHLSRLRSRRSFLVTFGSPIYSGADR